MMRRTLLLFGFLLAFSNSLLNLSADDKAALSGAEIVAKHLAAVGGKEALMKFKSRIALGTVKKESEPEAKMAIMSEAPNRLSAMYIFPNYTWQQTYDGSKAMFRPQLKGAASVFQEKYLSMLSSGTMFNGIALYNLLTQGESDTLKFEAKGSKKVKGRPAYVVIVKRGKDDSLRLYFDSETFMWVRTDYGRVTLTQNMKTFSNDVSAKDDQLTIDFYLETWDFKEVDGVKLPFKFEEVATAPILTQKSQGTIIGTITQYQHNEMIDPKMFQ
ncbi:MAG: hypothetical protein HY231_15230 [Acidobacteria bacterium]|nr:hypothetical protein [Acidobacteriota bacterium]